MLTLKWIPLVALGLVVPATFAEQPLVLTTPQEKASYCIGVDLAQNLQKQGVKVDADILAQGLKDVFAGGAKLLSEADIAKTLNLVKTQIRQRQLMAPKLTGDDNRIAGDAFLAANKAKPNVVTLPSGLQYLVLKAGAGSKPGPSDTVECRYHGTLLDGTEFEGSPRDGKTVTLNLQKIIPGLREALRLMPVGSKWQLFVPPQLGYRSWGKPPFVGPYATLIFDVELVDVK